MEERLRLLHRGRQLEVFTVAWNSAEGVVSIAFALLAGSIALIGFGVDSLIEMSSGFVLLWRLQTRRDMESAEHAETIALRLVGLSFMALASYIAFESIAALVRQEPPAASVGGIVIAILSLIVMPILARAKRRVAAAIESRALHADSIQTDICMILSAILLVGLGFNAVLGWWWTDPVAGMAMVPLIAREGISALRGERCEEIPEMAGLS
ncbi:MAG: cation transporter [Gemmatimonadetes bacterium]|nr:cation transporter [Gemmatimonadota bacterium]